MIVSEPQIDLAVACLYALSFVVLVVWLRRIDRAAWEYCVPVVAVIGLAAVLGVLQARSVLVVNGTTIPNTIDDTIAFTTLFVVVGMLADASRRQLLFVGGSIGISRVSFDLVNSGLLGGPLVIVGIGAVFVGYFVTIWVFVRPVWDSAQSVPPRQRLVHWKLRNLLLFMFAVLLLSGIAILAGLVNPFEQAIAIHHVNLVIRLGMAAFVFTNATDLTGKRQSGGVVARNVATETD